MNDDFHPDWASPGDTIADILREQGISKLDFGRQIGKTPMYVDRLIAGEEPITEDLAAKLAMRLGASPRFWMRRERQYRLDKARLDSDE